MTTLVTGSTGFVGRALLQHLQQHNMDVTALVRSLGARWPGSVRSVCVDAAWHAADFGPALIGVDAIVHLGARVHVMRDTDPDPDAAYRQVNVEASLNLARQAAAAGVRRFVYISSIKVNGEMTHAGQAFRESDLPAPADAYGRSKHAAEMALRLLGMQTGMEIVVIRPPLIYGAGVKANFATLARAVHSGWPLPLARIDNRRSLLALDNLVDFIRVCTGHALAANDTFLVCDAQDVSTPDLVRAMARAAGVPARLVPVPVPLLMAAATMAGRRATAQRLCGNLQIDSTRARQRLAWVPPVDLEQGLRGVFAQLNA